MHRYYKEYYWDKGFPYGTESIDPSSHSPMIKIITDAYGKHVSIEEYKGKDFIGVIYDSHFIDFRKLQPAEHTAWRKETLEESPQQTVCLLRNSDDRIICKEVYHFQDNLCRTCLAYSPHHILVFIQKMFYTALGDPFNGVVLYDAREHPIMYKCYAVDQTNTFTDLLSEHWNPKHCPPFPNNSKIDKTLV